MEMWREVFAACAHASCGGKNTLFKDSRAACRAHVRGNVFHKKTKKNLTGMHMSCYICHP